MARSHDTPSYPTNSSQNRLNSPQTKRNTRHLSILKVGQDVMGFQYFAQHGLPVVRVRPFNHSGPGQDARFVIPSFAQQLAQIEAGEREPVAREHRDREEEESCTT